MKHLIAKIMEFWGKQPKKRKLAIIAGSYAFLIVLLCISIIIQVNIQSRYSRAVASMQEQVYQNLAKMEELFTYVDAENVDVEHKLVPQLKGHYTAAVELNNAITLNYGSNRSVLSPEQIEGFDAAFAEYSNAFSSGLSTNLARDDMAVLLAEVQDALNCRYNPTPIPTETPVIIDSDDTEKES